MEYAIDHNAYISTATADIQRMYDTQSFQPESKLEQGVVLAFNYPDDEFSSIITVKPSSFDYKMLTEKYGWVEELFSKYGSLSSVAGTAPFYKEITKLLIAKSFSDVDALIRCVAPHECSDLFLIGLARLTLGYKDQLPSWKGYVQDVVREATNRKIDQRALSGLV